MKNHNGERRYSRIIRHRRCRLGLRPYTPSFARALSLMNNRNQISRQLIRRCIELGQSLRRTVELETKLDECRQYIQGTETESGCCMCGSEKGHCDDSHGFTDSGLYHSGQLVEQINTLLAKGLRDHQHGLTTNELRQALNRERGKVVRLLYLLGDVQDALYRWQNGHGFDNHGKDREIEERIREWRAAK